MRILIVSVTLALFLPLTVFGGDIEPKGKITPEHYICYRTTGPINVDGKLDEPSWERARWTKPFVDIEGDLKPKPRFKTQAKMLWDDEYLYIGAQLEEPDVWATLTQRDTVIFFDNDFEVFIDPDSDTQEYYEFEMNARNTGWDLFLVKAYRDGGPAVIAWDIAGLKTAVFVQGTLNQPRDVDKGWSVELAFPWKILREAAHCPLPPETNDQWRINSTRLMPTPLPSLVSREKGDQWRINFSRVEYQVDKTETGYKKKEGSREDNWVWSPQGLINMHYPEMWGFMQFSTKAVGTGEDIFVKRPEDEARDILRKLYYKEIMYYEQQKRFTSDLKALGIEKPDLVHYVWPPRLQITDSMFEASIQEREDFDKDGKLNRWHIRQDSKTWKE